MTTTTEQLAPASASPAVDAALAAGETRTRTELLKRFPPRPAAPSWPTTQVDRSAMVSRLLAPPFALPHPVSQQTRRLGVLAVTSWLASMPGETWQDRWLASGAEDQPDWRALVTAATVGRATAKQPSHLSPGLLVLICADVIRPSLGWLLRFAPVRRNLGTEMARTRDAPAFAALINLLAVDASRTGSE